MKCIRCGGFSSARTCWHCSNLPDTVSFAALESYRKDAERWRKLKSFALPRYVVKWSSGDGASLYKEGEVTVMAASWDAMEVAIDAAPLPETDS